MLTAPADVRLALDLVGVFAFALSGGSWLLVAALRESEDVRVPPFDAISFSLGLLWPDDAPADPSTGS